VFIIYLLCSDMWSYLWQNFLVDTKVQNYIAEKIKKIYDSGKLECILEIWPWKWAITKKIKNISDKFFVVEKDLEMKKYLENILDSDQIKFWDVLDTSIQNFIDVDLSKVLIVWNLPYYITSPIFRKFFCDGSCRVAGGFFMIQDEVWQKIQTTATKKSYLWRLINYWYDVIYHKTVWAKSFNPPPKVKSCLVEFKKKQKTVDVDFDLLVDFLDLYSSFSRKTLWAINKILQKQWKQVFNIPEIYLKSRMEELDINSMHEILKK
jgi:16S rRNA (adenine1518-N6/adenine1519-N6)-dimethyltransferase